MFLLLLLVGPQRPFKGKSLKFAGEVAVISLRFYVIKCKINFEGEMNVLYYKTDYR